MSQIFCYKIYHSSFKVHNYQPRGYIKRLKNQLKQGQWFDKNLKVMF